MSIIIFLIILSVLVFVHELGHFLFAKKNGIRVDEFAIGFPPRIFSVKRGETRYSINLLPLGGYVKIFGENPDEESISGPDRERSFINKKRPVQAAVLFAGILFNILFAWVLFTGSFMAGVVNIDPNGTGEGKLYVTNILPESPAEIADLRAGDEIVALSSKAGTLSEISADSVRKFVNETKDKEVTVSVKRGDEFIDLRTIPSDSITAGEYIIGIQMAEVVEVKLPLHKAAWEGLKTTGVVVKETAVGIVKFLWNIVTFSANFKDVAGPV
ncbi:MAG TPA: site-2 protease family protein, partial [Candidatus Paceibacterota bacterium]|nr:site-2 protease family protein [Candidatus Paceibacterota bacterium]